MNRDRVGHAKGCLETLELDFKAAVHGAILCRRIGDDEDLRAALFEDQLGGPGAGMLKGGGVFGIEELTKATQPIARRRRNHTVCVRPKLSHTRRLPDARQRTITLRD